MSSVSDVEVISCEIELCGVCGDDASCYRLYGATVCYSCKIFFWRVVKSKKKMECSTSYIRKCFFDKYTRNKCRKCRYDKCLMIGMIPELVNWARKQKDTNQPDKVETSKEKDKPKTLSISSVIKSNPQQIISETRNTNWSSLTDQQFQALISYQFEESCKELLENLTENDITESVEAWKFIIGQIKEGRKIVLPNNFEEIHYEKICEIVPIFIQKLLRNISPECLNTIGANINKSYIGLSVGLEHCFRNRSFFEQGINAYPYSSRAVQWWTRTFPEIHSMVGVPLESYEIQTTPWAESIHDEEFVSETFQQLDYLIQDDTSVSKLFTFLLLLSPTVKCDAKEEEELQQIQKKMSMLLYNYMMNIHDKSNSDVFNRITRLVNIIGRLNSCGDIYQNKMLKHQDIVSPEEAQDLCSIEVSIM